MWMMIGMFFLVDRSGLWFHAPWEVPIVALRCKCDPAKRWAIFDSSTATCIGVIRRLASLGEEMRDARNAQSWWRSAGNNVSVETLQRRNAKSVGSCGTGDLQLMRLPNNTHHNTSWIHYKSQKQEWTLQPTQSTSCLTLEKLTYSHPSGIKKSSMEIILWKSLPNIRNQA